MVNMCQNLNNNIQEAEGSSDWEHIPNSELLLGELRSYIDNIAEGLLFTSDVRKYWKETALDIEKRLESQKERQSMSVPWRFKSTEQIGEIIKQNIRTKSGLYLMQR